jgi:hypothetical protein
MPSVFQMGDYSSTLQRHLRISTLVQCICDTMTPKNKYYDLIKPKGLEKVRDPKPIASARSLVRVQITCIVCTKGMFSPYCLYHMEV